MRQTAFSTEIIILHLFMKTNRRISRLFLAAIFAAVPFASWVHANPTSQNYPFSNPETARSAQVAEPSCGATSHASGRRRQLPKRAPLLPRPLPPLRPRGRLPPAMPLSLTGRSFV